MFMAPEILNKSKRYNKTCDLWSVGVIMFVMLTGKHPYNHYHNEGARLQYTSSSECFQMDHESLDDVSKEAKDLILQMMEVDYE